MKNKLLSSGCWLFAILLFLAMAPPLIAQSSLTTNTSRSQPIVFSSSDQVAQNRSESAVVITHSLSQEIHSPSTIACGVQGSHNRENRYYRNFNLSGDFGITDDFEVTHAEFGVESIDGSLGVTVNIYSMTGAFPNNFPGGATLQGTATYTVNIADEGSVVSVPVAATIPAGANMIYELISHDGAPTVTMLYLGSNDLGQTDPSYIVAENCDITSPTALSAINYPNVHMIMNIVSDPDDDDPTPPGECEWTVIVEEDYYGDEVAWELRTMDGTVLLSGGDYGDGYYDEQTVTAEGPLEFWITNDGFYGDNTPTYSVSNGTQVLVSGIMPMDGDTLTFSDLNCGEDDDDPTPPGDDCSQSTASNDIENGYGNMHLLILANDFTVAQHGIFHLDEITANFLLEPGQSLISADLIFYEDSGNGPGAEITSLSGVIPSSQSIIDGAFGFDLHEITFTLDDALTFNGAGSGETSYWLGVQIEYNGDNSYMEVSSIFNTPNMAYLSSDDGVTWESSLSAFDQVAHGVLNFSGICETEDLDDCAGTPEAGVTSVSPTTGNPGTTYTVSNSGQDFLNGMSYQWQSNTDGAGWIDEGDATGTYSSYTATAPDELDTEVEWRLAVTCIDSNETAYSDPALFTTVFQYCTPAGTNSSYYIDSFSTTGGVINISNLNSGFSTGGYGDFYDDHTVGQVPGQEISFLAEFPTGQTYGLRIWVDWNQDGEFDETEEVAWNSSSYLNPQSGSFTVPADALVGETRMRIVGHWLNSSAEISPCATNHTYGEFEDYKFIVEELDDCTGTPNPGIVSVNPEEGNVGSTYTVSSSGYDYGNGFTYQWQSNTDGAGWVNEGDATTMYESYTATAPDEIDIVVEWRLEVTCTLSSESAISNVATFTSGKIYCTPEGINSDRFVNNFSTTGGDPNISNLGSGFSTGGYGDFYDTHAVGQIHGQSVNFSVDISGGTAGFRVWVDWNQNGTFEEDEVVYASSSYADSHTGSFTVPVSALVGETRMRIVSHWLSTSGDVDPCATGFTYGEFEDYKFVVGELDDCTGTPDAGITTVSPATGNIGTNYTVSNSGHDFGNGMSYQWQSNTDGAGWVDEGDATDTYSAYTATAPNEIDVEVEWRLAVTCLASNETSYSDSATFTTTMEYCTPSMDCTDGDVITNVTFQEIDNDSGCSPDGYGDYTHLSATVQAGGTYPISVTVGDGWTEHVFVWIDFGNDGTFGPEDYMGEVGEGGQGVTLDGEISIPGDIEEGEYRMRVLVWAGPTQDDPCVSSGFGEAEDYTVIVDGVVGINDNAYTNFSYYPNPAESTLYLKSDVKIESVSGYNVLGQKVISNNQFNNGQVDVSNLSSGAYLFEVIFENGTTETFRVLRK